MIKPSRSPQESGTAFLFGLPLCVSGLLTHGALQLDLLLRGLDARVCRLLLDGKLRKNRILLRAEVFLCFVNGFVKLQILDLFLDFLRIFFDRGVDLLAKRLCGRLDLLLVL